MKIHTLPLGPQFVLSTPTSLVTTQFMPHFRLLFRCFVTELRHDPPASEGESAHGHLDGQEAAVGEGARDLVLGSVSRAPPVRAHVQRERRFPCGERARKYKQSRVRVSRRERSHQIDVGELRPARSGIRACGSEQATFTVD